MMDANHTYTVQVLSNTVPVLRAEYEALDLDHAKRIARALAESITALKGPWTIATIDHRGERVGSVVA